MRREAPAMSTHHAIKNQVRPVGQELDLRTALNAIEGMRASTRARSSVFPWESATRQCLRRKHYDSTTCSNATSHCVSDLHGTVELAGRCSKFCLAYRINGDSHMGTISPIRRGSALICAFRERVSNASHSSWEGTSSVSVCKYRAFTCTRAASTPMPHDESVNESPIVSVAAHIA